MKELFENNRGYLKLFSFVMADPEARASSPMLDVETEPAS